MGSFIFASVNSMNYITQSRRDDLISLCYLLVYMVNGDLPFIFSNHGIILESKRAQFDKIVSMKNTLTPEKLVNGTSAEPMLQFIKYIFYMRFTEAPKYGKLRFMLVSILLDQNQVPDKIFDWSPQPPIHQQANKFKVSDGSYDEDKMGQVDELRTNNNREESKRQG